MDSGSSDNDYLTGYVGKWHLPKEGENKFWGLANWHLYRSYYDELKNMGIEHFYDYHGSHLMDSEWVFLIPRHMESQA